MTSGMTSDVANNVILFAQSSYALLQVRILWTLSPQLYRSTLPQVLVPPLHPNQRLLQRPPSHPPVPPQEPIPALTRQIPQILIRVFIETLVSDDRLFTVLSFSNTADLTKQSAVPLELAVSLPLVAILLVAAIIIFLIQRWWSSLIIRHQMTETVIFKTGRRRRQQQGVRM